MSDNNGIHHFMSINETNNNSQKKNAKMDKTSEINLFLTICFVTY